MSTRRRLRGMLAPLSLALTTVGAANAQQPGSGAAGAYQAQQSLSASAYGAATVGPSTPFLSPYLMTMGQANPDYMTYLYLQNQRNGGIGSGVISGVRPAPGAPAGSALPAPGASTTNLGTSRNSTFPSRPPVALNRVALPMNAVDPAGNAGASFMRGPRTNGDAGRYFNRTTPARNAGR